MLDGEMRIPSGYVKIAIENDHSNSEFSYWKWWFSIVMLVYQRVKSDKPWQIMTNDVIMGTFFVGFCSLSNGYGKIHGTISLHSMGIFPLQADDHPLD